VVCAAAVRLAAAFLVASTAGLASCSDETPSMKAARENDRVGLLPGRYQMVPAAGGKVYVLDTRDGWVRLCGPRDSADSVGCGSAASQ